MKNSKERVGEPRASRCLRDDTMNKHWSALGIPGMKASGRELKHIIWQKRHLRSNRRARLFSISLMIRVKRWTSRPNVNIENRSHSLNFRQSSCSLKLPMSLSILASRSRQHSACLPQSNTLRQPRSSKRSASILRLEKLSLYLGITQGQQCYTVRMGNWSLKLSTATKGCKIGTPY